MKIEQKAKAYDEALKKAKDMLSYKEVRREDMEYLFPELKESEGERMVKFIKKQLFNIKKTITDNYELDAKLTKAIEWLEKQGEQKPAAWSEEDEEMCQETIDWFEEKCFPYAIEEENPAKDSIKWLKSIKDRVQPKQEWSEEDENTRKKIIKFLKEQNYFDGKANEFKEPYKKEYEWLKSLKDKLLNKPQSQWKPSEEQIEILDMVLTNESMDDNIARILRELQEALKKLKGE